MAKKPFEVGQSNPPPSGVVRMVVGDVICVVDSVLLSVVVVDWVLLAVDDDPDSAHFVTYKHKVMKYDSNIKC